MSLTADSYSIYEAASWRGFYYYCFTNTRGGVCAS